MLHMTSSGMYGYVPPEAESSLRDKVFQNSPHPTRKKGDATDCLLAGHDLGLGGDFCLVVNFPVPLTTG